MDDNTLPVPFTPPGSDLRNFPYMALDVVRLRDSDVAALPNAEAFRCAMLLWCASWHQVPAASLPNNDGLLARLAGYGRDMKAFRRARLAGGMCGWTLCSDNRFYHPAVAEKAIEALAAKQRQRERTSAATAARVAKTGGRATRGNGQPVENAEDQCDVTSVAAYDATTHVTLLDTLTVALSKGEDKIGEDKEYVFLATKSAKPAAAVRGAAKSKSSRGSRLSPDWVAPEEFVKFAASGGLNAAHVAPRFRDFWVGKSGAGATKVDWFATWRNWCRNETIWKEPDTTAASPSLPVSAPALAIVKTGKGDILTAADLWDVAT